MDSFNKTFGLQRADSLPNNACLMPHEVVARFASSETHGVHDLPAYSFGKCSVHYVQAHATATGSDLAVRYQQQAFLSGQRPLGPTQGPWVCCLTYKPSWRRPGDHSCSDLPAMRVAQVSTTKDSARRLCCDLVAALLPAVRLRTRAEEDRRDAAVGLTQLGATPDLWRGGRPSGSCMLAPGYEFVVRSKQTINLGGFPFEVSVKATVRHAGEGNFELVGIELNPGPDEYEYTLPSTAVIVEFADGTLIILPPNATDVPFWRVAPGYKSADLRGGKFFFHEDGCAPFLSGAFAAVATPERHAAEGNTELVGVELNPGPKGNKQVEASFIGPLKRSEVRRPRPKVAVKSNGKVVVKDAKPKITVMSFVLPKPGAKPVVVKAWVHDLAVDGDVERNPGPDAVSTLYTPAPSLMLSGDVEPNPGPESVEQMIEPTQPTRARSDYKKAFRDYKFVSRHDGLTRGGNEAIFQLLDAFHDSDVNAQDFPTGVNGKVIVEAVTRQVTVAKPPTLPAGSTWDLHVTTNGFAGGTNNIAGFDAALGTSGVNCGMFVDVVGVNGTSVGQNFGPVGAPVLMHRVANGVDTFKGVVNTGDVGAIDVPPEYLKGPCRVVGVGIELVNTTAPLYKNGSVTVYRLPANYKEFTVDLGLVEAAGARVYVGNVDVGASAAPINCQTSVRTVAGAYPPTNLSDAALAQNAAMWNASEGVYLQALYESIPEMEPPAPVLPGWFNDDADVGVASARVTTPWATMNYSPGAVQRRVSATSPSIGTSNLGAGIVNNFQWDILGPKMIKVPIARTGAYFSGLHESSTFTMRVRYYIARVPSINEGQLYVLARKAVPFDEEFWKLYTQVCSTLPPGCMFTDNPLGEWFGKVLKIVRDYAPIVGHALGTVVPGAALVGKGVGMAAGAVKDAYKLKKKKKLKS